MNKSELIKRLAVQTGHQEKEAAAEVQTTLNTMSDALAAGDSIEIRGFGSFKIKDYGPYMGRNPKSGEKIYVAPKKLPVFKAGKELRERVNEE